jgi:acyl-CoA synthetase (NDP forming)/RimJ/RimL family protein N-acetyltransferase
MSDYPAHQDVDAVIHDGSTVRIRPLLAGDRQALRSFLEGLSEESLVFRFFSPVKDLTWAVDRFLELDYRDNHGLVALRGPGREIVGHGCYMKTRPGRAEVALEVADSMQGEGLGTILVGHLAQAAVGAGIQVFEAEVMVSNHRMLKVFRASGFPISTRSAEGAIYVEFPTSPTAEALDRFERRDQIAAVAALRRVLEPRAIAVIVGSGRRGTFGGEVFHNLLVAGFPGPVHPISPQPVVHSVPAYPDVRQVPGEVDLAVVAVRAEAVPAVARACGEKGVRALVVLSAGFAETGAAGAARQAELLAICRESGMRLIGPNCMGVINTDPAHRLNATFAPEPPPTGRAGFMAQSGALGLAVIDQARDMGLGLSSFVSVGNRADISTNDLLEYWEEDTATGLVLLYLESFGNPRRFARIARRVGRKKPILAVKSGRAGAGRRPTGSHTGALMAAADFTLDALFRQSGVIRTDNLRALFDVAHLLSSQPAPAGPRVGLITNSGGVGELCADSCAAAGLLVPELAAATRGQLARTLPPASVAANPVHLAAGVPTAAYETAIAALGASGEVDALIVICVPPLPAWLDEVIPAIRRGVAGLDEALPAVAVIMSAGTAPAALSEGPRRVPCFGFPEDAAHALARAAEWSRWRQRAGAAPAEPLPDERTDEATALIAAALGHGEGWLGFPEAAGLLDCYGIAVAEWRPAAGEREAAAAARDLGGAVALKAVAPGVVRKREAGAVALGLAGDREVGRAARQMAVRLRRAGRQVDGFLVQSMAPPGRELLVGVVHDPVFGPVVACGTGGDGSVETTSDLSVRVTPIAPDDAEQMLRELAAFPQLEGRGGRPAADLGSLRDLLVRVGHLVENHEEVAELDLNPVVAGPGGSLVIDARVRLQQPRPASPYAARRRATAAG